MTRELRLIPRIKLINTRVNGTRECKLSRELYRSLAVIFAIIQFANCMTATYIEKSIVVCTYINLKFASL